MCIRDSPSCGEIPPPSFQRLPASRSPLVDRHRKPGSSENQTRQNEYPEDSHAKYRDRGQDQDGLKNLLPFPATGSAAHCYRSAARQRSGAGGSVRWNDRRVGLNLANGECETAAGWDEIKGVR